MGWVHEGEWNEGEEGIVRFVCEIEYRAKILIAGTVWRGDIEA